MDDESEPERLNCPTCRSAMVYVGVRADGIRVYHCSRHGAWYSCAGGLFRPDETPEPEH